MEDNTVMIEAVVCGDETAKKVFKAFCDDPKALRPTIAPDEKVAEMHHIVCGFANPDHRQLTVGSIEKMLPGKIDWR